MKTIRVELYEQQVYFTKSRKEMNKVFPDDPVDGEGIARRCVNKESGFTAFFIGVFDGDLSTLAHECTHISFFLLEHVGVDVKPGEPNEAFAYLTGYLFKKLRDYV